MFDKIIKTWDIDICFSNTLNHIDLEMDRTVKAFAGERSASDIWKPSVNAIDRSLIFIKFLSHMIHNGAHIVTNILSNGKYKFK